MEVPMAMGRPKAVLVLGAELREQLESLANSRSLPAGLVCRAMIILLNASGTTNVELLASRDRYSRCAPIPRTHFAGRRRYPGLRVYYFQEKLFSIWRKRKALSRETFCRTVRAALGSRRRAG